MRSLYNILFWNILCLMVKFSWEINYGLCDNVNIYCVNVFDCTNCDGTSLETVINGLDGSGGYTIYLVGTTSQTVTLEESIVITKTTPENIFLANEINSYPGHSIIWSPTNPVSSVPIVSIRTYWWSISSGEGELVFKNRNSDTMQKIIEIDTASSTGVMLSGFEMDNLRSTTMLGHFISTTAGPMDTLLGLSIDGVTFKGFESSYTSFLYVYCNGGCASNSYTDEYGVGKRIWFKNNRFENAVDSNHIKFFSAITIEGNYFSGDSYFGNLCIEMAFAQEGFSIFNNIFHIQSSTVSVLYTIYRKEGHFTSYGKYRFFNNLILFTGSGSIKSNAGIFRYHRVYPVDGTNLPPTYYFYNNLIKYTSCQQMVHCYPSGVDGDSLANIRFSDNRYSLSCGVASVSACAAGTVLADDGGNEFVAIPFLGSGNIPSPYYDLSEDVPGLPMLEPPNNGWQYEYVLPEDDFEGRDRGGGLSHLRSKGPFQFQCSAPCLVDGKIDCQRSSDCGCMTPYFGDVSCQFIYGTPNPACGDHGEWGKYNYDYSGTTFFCGCDNNYGGEFCGITSCHCSPSNGPPSLLCGGHGSCEEFDHCDCYDHYFGTYCNVTSCFGVLSNDTLNVCSKNHGICSEFDHCDCYDGYLGVSCNQTYCDNGNSSLCSDHGICVGFGNQIYCICEENYFGDFCNVSTCDGVFSNETEGVCSGHGECMAYEECACTENYYGSLCDITTCYGEFSNDSASVCSGHGLCSLLERHCECVQDYYGDFCNITQCFDFFSNESGVCSEHGKCQIFSICDCSSGYYGSLCNVTVCEDGNYNNDTDVVCHGFGTCEHLGQTCECHNNSRNTGRWCNASVCYGYAEGIDEQVCSGHGSCVSPENCSCLNSDYDGDNCQYFFCGNISNTNDSFVCNGHGECVDHEICECRNRYNGTYCTEFYCFGVHMRNTGDTCTRHGECVDTDVCTCSEKYVLDGDCSKWECFGELNNETDTVCSGHGECFEVNNCSCRNGYGDFDCRDYMCGNYRYVDERACSSKGTCIGFDECSCDSHYFFNATSAREEKENVVCAHCPIGTHFEGSGGRFSDCELCPPGTFSIVENDDGCVTCPEGTYSHEDRHICMECPIGTYNAQTGRSSVDHCLPCPKGYYGNSVGTRWVYGCIPCPQNTRNPNLGSSSLDDCVPCHLGEICPVGSVKSFPLAGEDLKKQILYEDLGIEEVTSGEVTYEFKIIVMSVVLSICTLTLCLVCVTSNSCFLCELTKKKKKDQEDPKKRKCFETFFCCICGLCPTFRTFDWYYSMEHDVGEGESKVKMSTKTGGCFSIVAVSIFCTFLIWSISDFVYGSKKINTSADFYQANETNQIQGDMQYIVDFYGSFDNCSMDESDGLDVKGLGMDKGIYSCSNLLYNGQLIGCSCRFDCIGCLVKKSEMLVQLTMVHGGEYVRRIRYTIVLPSFNDETYNITGTFFEGNGTCDTVDIDISLYPRRYEVQSNWNLLLGLLDLEEWGKKTLMGIGAGVLSIEKNIVHHPGLESLPGKTPFSFNLKLSNFEQIVEEYFPQTLLNFVAQIFSLIGVSISIVGIFFGRVESFQGCCSGFCSSRKREKVRDSGEDKELLENHQNDLPTVTSLMKKIEVLEAQFGDFRRRFGDEDVHISYEKKSESDSEEDENEIIPQKIDDDEFDVSEEKKEAEEYVPDVELKRVSEDSSSSVSEQNTSSSESEKEED